MNQTDIDPVAAEYAQVGVQLVNDPARVVVGSMTVFVELSHFEADVNVVAPMTERFAQQLTRSAPEFAILVGVLAVDNGGVIDVHA
jgi:hypothetical protein